MRCFFALLLVGCGVRNPEAKAFYDEVEQGSQWKLTFSAGAPWDPEYGYPGPCPTIRPKMAHVPDNQTTGCEPDCTCEFSFEFDDTARYGPVAARLTQECADKSYLRCENDDPAHEDTSDCEWYALSGVPLGNPDCGYKMSLIRE